MRSDANFDSAVERIRNYVDRIGDSIDEPIVDPDRGGRTIGFAVDRDTYRYQVLGQPTDEFFNVTFPFSIVNQLEQVMTDENAREILAEADDLAEPIDEDDEAELRHRAAHAVLDTVSASEREAFVYHLVIILSSPATTFVFQHTDDGMVAGFQVFTKIFPYEQEFSLTTFDSSVQSVVNTGMSGLLFVNLAFDLPSMIDVGGVTGMPLWYIQ